MTFATPSAPSGGIEFKNYLGALLIIDVLGVEEHVPTVHTKPGEKSPAVRANVSVIDGANAGEEFPDCLLFPKILQSQTKSHVGEKVLGRLGQGVAKPGQSAPWQLLEATEADKAAGTAYLQRNTSAFASAAPAATGSQPPF